MANVKLFKKFYLKILVQCVFGAFIIQGKQFSIVNVFKLIKMCSIRILMLLRLANVILRKKKRILLLCASNQLNDLFDVHKERIHERGRRNQCNIFGEFCTCIYSSNMCI